MAIPEAKAATAVNKVISLPKQGRDSLLEAINQFMLWEMRSRDCIKVKRCYIDVAQDLEAGVLLSQIIYWHLPDKEGKQKLTVHRDGNWWLAKARSDWWAECRLTPKQFDRAIRHLEQQQLVCTKVYKWQGQNTKHIRVNWAGLLQGLSMLDASPDSVVGFRRREPVKTASRAKGKLTEKVTPESPISQSSELPIRESCELPISQSCEFPISQSLNYLIGDSRIPKQGSSELPNREFHLYTEITPEITPEITTLPPNPPSDEQPSECASPEVASVEVEVMKPDSPSSQSQTSHPTSRQEPTDSGLGNYSATRRPDENRYHPDRAQFPKNLDGSDRLPWDTNKRGVFDPEFEKHMARSLMQYPAYRDLMAGELMTKVRKHISAGRYDLKRRDELLIEWEAMQSGADTGDMVYGITAKAASRRALIRSALSS